MFYPASIESIVLPLNAVRRFVGSSKFSSRIISESESSCCFTNAGSTVTVTFNLPAATTDNIGFHCWFAVEVFLTESMRIHPAEIATTIRVGGTVTNSGDDLSSGSSGVTLHLICTGLNRWVALRHIGTWLT